MVSVKLPQARFQHIVEQIDGIVAATQGLTFAQVARILSDQAARRGGVCHCKQQGRRLSLTNNPRLITTGSANTHIELLKMRVNLKYMNAAFGGQIYPWQIPPQRRENVRGELADQMACERSAT